MRSLIKKILNEEVPFQVRRRQVEFDRIFLHYRNSFIGHEYKFFKSFWNMIFEVTMETLYHAWFSKTVKDDDWEESAEYIENYLIKKYKDETKQMWEKKHHKRLNESEDDKEKKIQKNLKAIRTLLDTIDFDGLCEMWVEYNPEDGDYEIRSKRTRKNLDTEYMVAELRYIEDTIKSWGLRTYVFAPWYVENCEDEVEFLNESKSSNRLNILNDLVEPFKEDDCICDIDMWYDDEDDMYLVYLVFGTEELNDKFTSDGKFGYVRKKQKEVEETIKSYLPIKNIRVGSYGTPHCGWKSLNESEEKKSKLLSIIEENGLYNLVSSTGLHINEIEQKVGQLSREVLERFIIDVVKEHHNAFDDDSQTYIIYLEDYPYDVVPIGNNDFLEQLTVTNNELLFVVSLYEEDKYGDLEFSSEELTPSKNLLYANIYEIAGQLGFFLANGRI